MAAWPRRSCGCRPAPTCAPPSWACPDDLCPCPHWGYVLSGRSGCTRATAPGLRGGQAFYWAAGHAPEALEDSEYVDFSPAEEFEHVISHITSQG